MNAWQWYEKIQIGMEEDRWQQDWTTLGTTSPQAECVAEVICKQPGIWAAEKLTLALQSWLNHHQCHLTVQNLILDGSPLESGTVVAQFKGKACDLLRIERTYLNLAAYACGIATQTRKMVWVIEDRAESIGLKEVPRLVTTRKGIPGYRELAVSAVIAGGGYAHRLDLASGVLIKENHIVAAGNIEKAIHGARRAAPHGMKIEVEVRDLNEVTDALKFGADILLLDNFQAKEIPAAVEKVKMYSRAVLLEVSGGIDAENVADFVQPGVNIISSGSLTHTLKTLDLSLLIR